MYIDVSASAKVESTQVIDDMEDKINSCLADVRSDASDVVDVIRKAITDDDDTRYCNIDTCYIATVEKFLLIFTIV